MNIKLLKRFPDTYFTSSEHKMQGGRRRNRLRNGSVMDIGTLVSLGGLIEIGHSSVVERQC